MGASTIQQAGILTGRQMVLAGVVGLHALVIGALMTMKIAIDGPAPLPAFKPVTATPVEPLPPEARPELKPELTSSRIIIPSVLPPIITEEYQWVPPVAGTVIDTTGDVIVPATEPAGTSEVPATELQYRATRSPDEFYPSTSVQLQEEGVAVVRVCVAPTGRIDGAPVIERSSGYRRLDAAALQWAREALAFTPATRNGTAVAACKGFRVNFNLR